MAAEQLDNVDRRSLGPSRSVEDVLSITFITMVFVPIIVLVKEVFRPVFVGTCLP